MLPKEKYMKNDKWTACGPLKEEVRDSDGNLICKSRAPNSALIAAAPELLAALEELFKIGQVFAGSIEGKYFDTNFRVWEDVARAAIAKAKGEL